MNQEDVAKQSEVYKTEIMNNLKGKWMGIENLFPDPIEENGLKEALGCAKVPTFEEIQSMVGSDGKDVSVVYAPYDNQICVKGGCYE